MFLPNILSLHLFSVASTIPYSILSNLKEAGIFYLSVRDRERWQKSIHKYNKEKKKYQESESVKTTDFFKAKTSYVNVYTE